MAVKLPRLPTNWQTQPLLLERYWDLVLTQIESILNSLLSLPGIKEALANVTAAVNAANTAAGAANTAANSVMAEASLVNSYPSGFTPPLLSADAAGVVTVAPHTRTYGNSVVNPPRSIAGGTISTGAAPGSTVRIYYDDPTRSGTGFTFQYTVDPASPPVQTGNRHSVGAVKIPTTGSQTGKELVPPGYVNLL